MQSLWKPTVVSGVGAFILLVAFPLAGFGQSAYFDNFEAPTFNPFWTLVQQNGSISLSTDHSVSGFQSAKLIGTGGGQVNVWLLHTFPTETQGTLSVWFYDTGAQIYAGLYADSTNPASSPGFSVNVADWDPATYVWHGPGVGETATLVPRTVGWHKLELQVTSTGFIASIDGAVVGAVPGTFTFNRVLLLVSGPGETGTFYFDDFSFIPPFAVPTTKEDCKDGGWKHLVRSDGSSFKNQGACVSYVNTGK
jgi:hypothetical protein